MCNYNKSYQINKDKKKITKKDIFLSSNEHRKSKNNIRNKALSSGICEEGITSGFDRRFMTLTSEDSRDNQSRALRELNTKFSKIKQQCEKQGITLFGIKAIEKHESGIYHLHAFCFSDDINGLQKIRDKYFRNSVNRNDESFKPIEPGTEWQIVNYINDMTFDEIEPEEDSLITAKISSYSKVSFFGLRKGTVSKWDKIYKSSKKYLDENQWKIKRHIVNRKYRDALIGLNAFLHHAEKIEKTVEEAQKPINKRENITLIIYIPRVSNSKIIEAITIEKKARGPPYFWELMKLEQQRQRITKKGGQRNGSRHKHMEQQEKRTKKEQGTTIKNTPLLIATFNDTLKSEK